MKKLRENGTRGTSENSPKKGLNLFFRHFTLVYNT